MTMNYTLAMRAMSGWMIPDRYASIAYSAGVQKDITLGSITGDDGVTVSLAGKTILLRSLNTVAIRRGGPAPALVAATGYVQASITSYTQGTYQIFWVDPGLDLRLSVLGASGGTLGISWSSDQ